MAMSVIFFVEPTQIKGTYYIQIVLALWWDSQYSILGSSKENMPHILASISYNSTKMPLAPLSDINPHLQPSGQTTRRG